MLMSPFADEVAVVIAEEKIPVVTTGAGNPSKFIPMWKDAGSKVIPVIPSCALARMVEKRGADAVIAEGGESGGHVGDLTTMALVPQVCDAVKIPVIAAGGIADGRGVPLLLCWVRWVYRWEHVSLSQKNAPFIKIIKIKY
jgi:enoyl-[acyl-carrier protein] reductase II